MKNSVIVLFATVAVLIASAAVAEVPQMINFQGHMSDAGGQPLDTTVSMVFSIYDDSTGGIVKWTNTFPAVMVAGGAFSVNLGETQPIDDSVFNMSDRFLGITIGGDTEITPRTRMVSTPFAFRVSTVDGATGGIISGDVSIQSNLTVDGMVRVYGENVDPWEHGRTGIVLGKEGSDLHGRSESDSACIFFPAHTNDIALIYTRTLDGETDLTLKVNDDPNDDILLMPAGNVGIGVTSPGAQLHVGGTAGVDGIMFPDGSLQTTAATGSGGGGWTDDGNVVRLETIDDSVGIGTVTPTEKLHVEGNVYIVGKAKIGPGHTNTGYNSFVAGENNTASNSYSTVSGGQANIASGHYSTISGGENNSAIGDSAVVGGGTHNSADGDVSSIGGGQLNTAVGDAATVSGGQLNIAGGSRSTVGGGRENTASSLYSTVSGGHINIASGDYSTVSGGLADTASGPYSTVGGGRENNASNYYTTVSGGQDNSATGTYATVGGGWEGDATGHYSTVGGGHSNYANNQSSTVSGGQTNTASGWYSTVSGGYWNRALGDSSIVSGGANNDAFGDVSTVGGGYADTASGYASTVSGGENNTASGDTSTVGGGFMNLASGDGSTVGGGQADTASGQRSTIGGGYKNIASGKGSTIGGGEYNIASDSRSTVGGGFANTASTNLFGAPTVGGGSRNTASGDYSTVGGGYADTASGSYSTIAGGGFNDATGNSATVGGGGNNMASASSSTVSGGHNNTASGSNSIVSGGSTNTASGVSSAISGGYYNTADGDYSYAAGYYANAIHDGAFVWGDYSDGYTVSSTAGNQFTARTTGGARFFTNMALTTGVKLAAGGGSWSSVSDRNVKENIQPVNGAEILEKISLLEVSRWNYKTQDPSIQHIGPMAQDLYRLFGVGDDDKTITTIDPDGISLAAIKALNCRLEKQATEMKTIKAENEKLKAKLTDLASQVEKILAQQGNGSGDLALNNK